VLRVPGAEGQPLRLSSGRAAGSVARTAVELHGCCARASLAAALLSQHIDGVARAGSAGTGQERVARALLGPAHHVGARRREPHGSGINYSSRRRSELGNRRPLYGGQLSSRHPPPYRSDESGYLGDLPTSSVSAVQLVPETMGSARTPPVHHTHTAPHGHAPTTHTPPRVNRQPAGDGDRAFTKMR
jgi:hypothetical protein